MNEKDPRKQNDNDYDADDADDGIFISMNDKQKQKKNFRRQSVKESDNGEALSSNL